MNRIAPRNLLTRREMLRLGLAGVGGTLLSTLKTERALAQGYEPMKLVFILTNFGVHPSGWDVSSNGTSLTGVGGAFSPLDAHRSDLVMTRGIGYSYGGGHYLSSSTYLTNTVHHGDAIGGVAQGRSFDHFMAAQLSARGVNTSKPALASITSEVATTDAVSWESAGLPFASTSSPSAFWRERFDGFTVPEPQQPVDTSETERLAIERRARTRALSYLQTEYTRLKGMVSSTEAAKLEETYQRIAEIENQRIAQLDPTTTVEPLADACSIPSAPSNGGSSTNLSGMLDVAVEALACNTEVLTVRFGGGELNGRWVADRAEHHGYHHAELPDQRNALTQWQAGQVANFISALKNKQFGSGSLFDRTLIVWSNEISVDTAGWHRGHDLPLILAGNLGGTIRTGQYLQHTPGDVTMSSVLVSIANAAGVTIPASLGGPDGYGLMEPNESEIRASGNEIDDVFESGGALRRPSRGPISSLLV